MGDAAVATMDDDDVRALLVQVLARLDAALAEFSRERFWRRASAVLVLLGFVSVAVGVSYLRQRDCDATNDARERLPVAVSTGIGSAWDRYGPSDMSDREALVTDVEGDVRRLYPPRDCAWPT